MGRMYATTFENVAVAALQDFFEIAPADDIPCVIHACYLSQVTDVGDSNEEMLRVAIIRGNATSGSGGGTANEVPLDSGDAAASYVGEINNTTEASTGTEVVLHAETFNIRTGWVYIPTPECRPRVDQGDGLMVVRLLVAPGTSINMSGTLIVEEI